MKKKKSDPLSRGPHARVHSIAIKSAIFVAVMVIFFGKDVKNYINQRQELTRLRDHSCALMVDHNLISQDAHADCRREESVYREGVLAAIRIRAPRVKNQVEDIFTTLNTVTDTLDKDTFDRITLDEFMTDHFDPLGFLNPDPIGPNPSQFSLDVDKFLITGYGEIRVEGPMPADQALKAQAANLGIADTLDALRSSPLQVLCRRRGVRHQGCSGIIYVRKHTGLLTTYMIVGLDLSPVTIDQIIEVETSLLLPDQNDLSRRVNRLHLSRFVEMRMNDGSF